MMQEISVTEAHSMLTDGSAHGIDVREANEWDAGHIDGTIWHALSDFNITHLPDDDKPIIFICRSGNRSGQVTNFLSQNGRTNVINMTGGMRAWHDAGLPMVAEHGAPFVA